VEFAGQKITNIYYYTYALDAVKIGDLAHMVVVRDGQQVTFEVTPKRENKREHARSAVFAAAHFADFFCDLSKVAADLVTRDLELDHESAI
jgi:hypothetical protein